MVSRKCEHCYAVKPCSMFLTFPDEHQVYLLVYLCRPCARALGYVARKGDEA